MRSKAQFVRRVACALAATGMLSMAVVTLGAPSSAASKVTKSVITFAESPGAPPDYIFPYVGAGYFSTANLSDFQYLMYRPLYWFGTKSTPTLNEKLSLADSPVSSNGDRTFKITLKTYKWSNGTTVTTTDVMFWLNIWNQKPTGYAGWFPGGLSMPTSIKSVKITSPKTMTIDFDRSFNPHWLLYNELSQITPLPTAWTKSSTSAAAGSAGCATAAYGADKTACKAVYDFLSEQSGFNPTHPKTTIDALPTYATNPLWQVFDGPWKLKSFGPTAPVVLVPNGTYSGPNKPTYKEFVEDPFTTASAEYNALVAGTIDWGYLPPTEITSDATTPSKPAQTVKPGSNNPRLGTYNLVAVYRWAVNYFWTNFHSTSDTGNAGPIFSQLYFRQAFQTLVDQPVYIDRLEHGYGVQTYGPVPVWPHNPYSSTFEETNPYPYSVSKAKALLTSHGWKVTPKGIDVCEKPGTSKSDCGKGVKKGAKLDFTLQYASGTKTSAFLMDAEKASWQQAGIRVNLSSATYDTVIGSADPCPKGCSWQIENWDSGWTFVPDYYPTGEEMFATGAEANSADFSTPLNDQLIKDTDTTAANLTQYEDNLAKMLPVVWQPTPVTVIEVRKGITHPQFNPVENDTPATLHWS